MNRRQSPAMTRAVALVTASDPQERLAPRAAAEACGVGLRALYAALKRAGYELRAEEVRARKSAAMKRAMADPEVRARKSAAMKRAMADPEVRARHAAAMKRRFARAAVKEAGLSMTKRAVERALALMDEHHSVEIVADALRQETYEARRGERAA